MSYEELNERAMRKLRPPAMERTGESPLPSGGAVPSALTVESKVESQPEAKVKTEPEPAPESEPRAKLQAGPLPEPIAVTVEEMHSDFEADRAAAEASFGGKIINVTGLLIGIAIDDTRYDACLILTGADKTVSREVVCVFDMKYIPAFRRLTMGQTVTVQAKYDSYTTNILVVDCVLVG